MGILTDEQANQLWNSAAQVKYENINEEKEYIPPAGSLMARLRSRYTLLPNIDGELCNFIITDPVIDELINTDFEKVTVPGNIYRKLAEKLRDFTTEETDQIITTYAPSDFWTSIPEEDRYTRIEKARSNEDENTKVIERHEKRKANTKTTKTDEVKKVSLHFREVGDELLKNMNVFTMSDTGEFFVYINGVYKSNDISRIVTSNIRSVFEKMYSDRFKDLNPDIPYFTIPSPTTNFIKEVEEYIRDYTFIQRKEVDSAQNRYINFKNGLFNLKTWELEQHDHGVMSIIQIPVNYDSEAECPAIDNYFKSCELPDIDIKSLEEYAGYCLTPDVRMQKALMIYGAGSNGKSVFINMLKEIIGYDNVSGETLHTLEEDKFRVANLYGKLLNAFPDLKDKSLQTNEVFNTLTGGDKKLTAERKYMNAFSFDPTTKLMFSANRIPFAYSDNFAYYRRWLMVKFPKTFKKEEIDHDLLEKLTTESEKSGFINRMLDGLKRIRANQKFTKDDTPEEVAEIYRLNSDNVAVYTERCCRDCKIGESPTPKKLVYERYTRWCDDKQIQAVKEREFKKRFELLGRKEKDSTYWDADTKKPVHHYFYADTFASSQEIA